MEITCDACGYPISSTNHDERRTVWKCPICGSPAHRTDLRDSSSSVGPGPADHRPIGQLSDDMESASESATTDSTPPTSSADRSNPADTVFQPALMMSSIMDELEPAAQGEEPAHGTITGTEFVGEIANLPSPFLDLEAQPYLLILGAKPGEERRPIVRAKTSFGRTQADVNLADPSVSSTHFQIEAFGSEFFVRDLESRNGTFLNNNRVRYSQLLAGDQITAGRTTLIFRLSDDNIDRD
jgi:hypothetical protein